MIQSDGHEEKRSTSRRAADIGDSRGFGIDRSRGGLILLALCSAALIINIDVTVVNVTLPSLVRQLGATTTNLQWVVDAYSLVFAALILAAGSLSTGSAGRASSSRAWWCSPRAASPGRSHRRRIS